MSHILERRNVNEILPLLTLFAGVALGCIGVWCFFRAKIEAEYQRGRQESAPETAVLSERVNALNSSLEESRATVQQREISLREIQEQFSIAQTKIAQLETNLQQERKQTEEKLKLLEEAKRQLSDTFKALASDTLKSSNTSFLELAKTHLEKFQESAQGDLEKRQLAIDEMVKPVKESLGKVDAKLQEIEKSRVEAYAGLSEQVKSLRETQESLRGETSNLVKALRRPQVRGRWGEIQLRRVVEMAGMLNYCDFYEQESTATEGGALRPDLLVRLPGKKNVVVDAKAPLNAYLEAVEAQDDETRSARLKDHARQVRTHISNLSKKSYFQQFDPAPEFVVLFLPGEVFFSAALEQDPSLIELGVENNVIIATPTTLISLLRAVAYGWRQETIAENAAQISKLGKELYDRVTNLAQHFTKVGSGLETAMSAYNKAVGALESRVLVSVRRFKELGAIGDTESELESPRPIEQQTRALQAPELTSGGHQDGV